MSQKTVRRLALALLTAHAALLAWSGLQSASFDRTSLLHATIRCDGPTGFQSASINDANFSDADVSAIARSLESCVFPPENPPRYNAGTRFPKDFNPAARGWRFVAVK